jgi:hypothetical protein
MPYDDNDAGLLETVGRAAIGKTNWRVDRPKDLPYGKRREADYALSGQTRGYQTELGTAIQDRALGRAGPSVAEKQMQQGLAGGRAAIASKVAGARGLSRGAAQRAGIRGTADLSAQTNQQTGLLRAQETIGAQQLAQQNWQAQRQQDLLQRGYSIDEANALMNAQLKSEDINARIAEGNAQRAQGPAMAGIGAIAGLAAGLSDIRAKEILYSDYSEKEMYSDFNDKQPAQPSAFNGDTYASKSLMPYKPDAPLPAGTVLQPATTTPITDASLKVQPATPVEDPAQKSRLEQAIQAGAQTGAQAGGGGQGGGGGGGGLLAGLQLGSMLSDFVAKEIDRRESSKRNLDPIDPVTYRYKPESSARMAGEETQRANLRAQLFSGAPLSQTEADTVGGAVYADKRQPRDGIVAQQLAQSPGYREAVVGTPAGLAVQRDRALSQALHDLAGVNQRVDALEDDRAGKRRARREPIRKSLGM